MPRRSYLSSRLRRAKQRFELRGAITIVTVELQDRLAVVTGGTRGIGKASAECLKAAGHPVLVTGTRRDAVPPDGCEYYAVDFDDAEATSAFADELRKRKPLVLVNNAGQTIPRAFADVETEEFLRLQRINLVAPLELSRAVLTGMRSAGWGRIVNVGSIWGVISRPERASYSASKGGLDGLTASLAAEVAKDGILANCVAPGFIETDLMLAATDETERRRLAAQVPMRRLGKPEEIGTFVAWLCSDENTYISGQTLIIDGGFTRV